MSTRQARKAEAARQAASVILRQARDDHGSGIRLVGRGRKAEARRQARRAERRQARLYRRANAKGGAL